MKNTAHTVQKKKRLRRRYEISFVIGYNKIALDESESPGDMARAIDITTRRGPLTHL